MIDTVFASMTNEQFIFPNLLVTFMLLYGERMLIRCLSVRQTSQSLIRTSIWNALRLSHSSSKSEHDMNARLKAMALAKPLRLSLLGNPFHFTAFTDVQEQVFSLLPQISSGKKLLDDGKGRDLLCKARTGTGKTVAFLVPALQARIHAYNQLAHGQTTEPFRRYLEENDLMYLLERGDKAAVSELQRLFSRHCAGVLIISPTRELAMQIASEARKLVLNHKKLRVHELVGGISSKRQYLNWKKNTPDIVVATPGRLLDMLDDQSIRDAISRTQTLVLDEADMLLELGFRDKIQMIASMLPPVEERMSFMFSATMDPHIMEVAKTSLHPQHRVIDCIPPGEENVHVRIPQYVTTIPDQTRVLPFLLQLLEHDQMLYGNKSKVIIFTSTTALTSAMHKMLESITSSLPGQEKTSVLCLHGMLSQTLRSRVSQQFRAYESAPSILLTSDVSARGVDYPSVTRVIQLGVPCSKEMYVHRVGRTGRRGREGRADMLISPFESGFVAFQLHDIPLQPLSMEDHAKSMNELVASNEAQATFDASRVQTAMDHARYCVRETMDMRHLLNTVFNSYVAMRQLLRVSRLQILHPVQNWIRAVFGLEEKPTLSPQMMSVIHSKKRGSHERQTSKRPFSVRKRR